MSANVLGRPLGGGGGGSSLGAFAVAEVAPGVTLEEFARTRTDLTGGATLATDFRAVWQAAADLYAPLGVPICLMTPGVYAIASDYAGADWQPTSVPANNRKSLICRSGLEFIAGDGVRIEGQGSHTGNAGMVTTPWLATAADPGQFPTLAIRGVKFRGGEYGRPGGYDVSGLYAGSVTGTIFSGIFADTLFDRVVVKGWREGDAFRPAGDEIRMEDCESLAPRAGTGTGGIRHPWGKGFRAERCVIYSGDDSLQLVPMNEGSTWTNLSIYDAWYIACKFQSFVSRGMIAALDNTTTTPITSEIRRAGFVDCHGIGESGVLLAVLNTASTGAIDDILFRNVSGASRDTGDNSDAEAIFIKNLMGASGGRVGLVTLEDVVLTAANARYLTIDGDVEEVRGKNWRLSGLRAPDASTQRVRIYGVRKIDVDGLFIDGAGEAAIQSMRLGSPDATVSAVPTSPAGGLALKRNVGEAVFNRLNATGIATNVYGVQAQNTGSLTVRRSEFHKAGGAALAGGINAAATVGSLRVETSDFTDVASSRAIISTATKTWTGPDNAGALSVDGATIVTTYATGSTAHALHPATKAVGLRARGGGGAGGGGARVSTAGASGGAGGGGAAETETLLPVSALASRTLNVTVGAGGTPGAGATVAGNAGGDGGGGGTTTIDDGTNQLLRAAGGGGGAGGEPGAASGGGGGGGSGQGATAGTGGNATGTAAGTGGTNGGGAGGSGAAGTNVANRLGAGGGGGVNAAAGSAGGLSLEGGCGGGAGGGCNATGPTAANGGVGRSPGPTGAGDAAGGTGAATGTAGTAGTAVAGVDGASGGGGGGGSAGNGGDGGAGDVGHGGGGGGSAVGGNGGAGGAGGAGEVTIVEYL